MAVCVQWPVKSGTRYERKQLCYKARTIDHTAAHRISVSTRMVRTLWLCKLSDRSSLGLATKGSDAAIKCGQFALRRKVVISTVKLVGHTFRKVYFLVKNLGLPSQNTAAWPPHKSKFKHLLKNASTQEQNRGGRWLLKRSLPSKASVLPCGALRRFYGRSIFFVKFCCWLSPLSS